MNNLNIILEKNKEKRKNIQNQKSYWWYLYCKLNNLPFFPSEKRSEFESSNYSSLKRKVLYSFTEFYSFYEDKLTETIQNTFVSKLFKNISLTKKNISLLLERLISLNSFNFVIFFYWELHSCWKPCHWKNNELKSDKNNVSWANHNRNLCQCFSNPKRKHWKCKRIFHSHNWHSRQLLLPSVKETKINTFPEEIVDKDTRLCYNMKDWINFKLRPKEYREAGVNFKKKWYWVIDSRKFLADREKKKIINLNYRLKNKDYLKERKSDNYLKNRKKLTDKKWELNNKLKKLAWDNTIERKKIKDKLQNIQFKLDSTKRTKF